MNDPTIISLPSPAEILRAIRLYLERAYGCSCPPTVQRLIPPEGFEPAAWLMGKEVQRDPADAPLNQVRSFAMRLGNQEYPHMKLRLSRPPKDEIFLFSVDSHDAFLHAPAGSPDCAPLEKLKKHNSALAALITGDWEAAGLPTEHNYLRAKIKQAQARKAPDDNPPAVNP